MFRTQYSQSEKGGAIVCTEFLKHSFFTITFFIAEQLLRFKVNNNMRNAKLRFY
jgi:hypothetical protein